jgi:hypothetical protein
MAPAPGREAIVFGGADASADNPTLLPAGLRAKLGATPKGDPVELSPGVQALRYRDLAPGGTNRPVTLFAVPTTGGVATLACVAPAGNAAAFAGQCDGVAATLRVTGAKALPVGPSKAYAATVSKAIGNLRAAERGAGGRLAKAKTPQAQAGAAGALSSAYLTAARALAKAQVGPADTLANNQLVAALRRTSAAYGKAAAAARRKDAGGFKRQDAAVRSAKAAVDKAIAKLRGAGYQIRS